MKSFLIASAAVCLCVIGCGKNQEITGDKTDALDITQKASSDFEKLLARAESNDAEAQYVLGILYAHLRHLYSDGSKVEGDTIELNGLKFKVPSKDIDAAKRYLLASANQDYLNAQHALGDLNNERDDKEAFKWYLKAAKNGHTVSMVCVGSMYERGVTVIEDYEEAFKWYNQSAFLGNPLGQFFLGLSYIYGRGVKKDELMGVALFMISSAAGTNAATEMKNKRLNINNTPEDFREEAQKLAKKLNAQIEAKKSASQNKGKPSPFGAITSPFLDPRTGLPVGSQ